MLSRSAALRDGPGDHRDHRGRLEGIPDYEQIVDAIITDIVATISKADNSDETDTG